MMASPSPKSGWYELRVRSPACSTSRYAMPVSKVMRRSSDSPPGSGAYAVRSQTMYMDGRRLP